VIDRKGLNHLKSLMNQPVGNHQCYALSAEYAGVLILVLLTNGRFIFGQ
jgi:hypothetical protein